MPKVFCIRCFAFSEVDQRELQHCSLRRSHKRRTGFTHLQKLPNIRLSKKINFDVEKNGEIVTIISALRSSFSAGDYHYNRHHPHPPHHHHHHQHQHQVALTESEELLRGGGGGLGKKCLLSGEIATPGFLVQRLSHLMLIISIIVEEKLQERVFHPSIHLLQIILISLLLNIANKLCT